MALRWRLAGATMFLALIALLAVSCGGGGGNRSAELSDVAETPGGPPARKSWAGTHAASSFPVGLTWFNVQRPLTLGDLKGKVVILDFWTLGCINCQHIIPDLLRLEAEFGDALVVIGVHSGKYATEHDDDSIREAIDRYGLVHPVVNDPDFAFWQVYGARAWPTLVVVDPAGNAVGMHAGEGVYPLLQPIVASLVAEFKAKGQVNRAPLPLRSDASPVQSVLRYPAKVVADEAGRRLFIADSGDNRVLVASLDGTLSAAIGSGKAGFADGIGSQAEFRAPQGLGLSADGKTLYVADTRNHAVRRVDLASLEVTTIAGTGNQLQRLPGSGTKGTAADLASPWDVVEAGGALFISMAGVHQIWKLDLGTGEIAVFAGTTREGIQDGDRLREATLAQPSGIAADDRYLYWVDPESSAFRRVPLAGQGEVDTLIGTGLFDYGDDDGKGTKAKLQHAQGLAISGGRAFIGDTYNHRIRAVDLGSREVTTLAGESRGRADGGGDSARFDEPAGLSVAGTRLYIADTNNHAIRVLDLASGTTTTLALSNLSVATSGAPGRRTTVTLDSLVVGDGIGNVQLRIAAPAGHHLNSQAPSRITLRTSDASVLATGEDRLSFSTDEGAVTLPVPVEAHAGRATLTLIVEAYYCREGEEALCFIHFAEVTVPIEVRAGGPGTPLLAYTLPPSGG